MLFYITFDFIFRRRDCWTIKIIAKLQRELVTKRILILVFDRAITYIPVTIMNTAKSLLI